MCMYTNIAHITFGCKTFLLHVGSHIVLFLYTFRYTYDATPPPGTVCAFDHHYSLINLDEADKFSPEIIARNTAVEYLHIYSTKQKPCWHIKTRDGIHVWMCDRCYDAILCDTPTWDSRLDHSMTFTGTVLYPQHMHPSTLLINSMQSGPKPLKMLCKKKLMHMSVWNTIEKVVNHVREIHHEPPLGQFDSKFRKFPVLFIPLHEVVMACNLLLQNVSHSDLPSGMYLHTGSYKPISNISKVIGYWKWVHATDIEYPGWALLFNPCADTSIGTFTEKFNYVHAAAGRFISVVNHNKIPIGGYLILTKKQGGYTTQFCMPLNYAIFIISKRDKLLKKWVEADCAATTALRANQTLFDHKFVAGRLHNIDPSESDDIGHSTILDLQRAVTFAVCTTSHICRTPFTDLPGLHGKDCLLWPPETIGDNGKPPDCMHISFRHCFTPVQHTLRINHFNTVLVFEHKCSDTASEKKEVVAKIAFTKHEFLSFCHKVPYLVGRLNGHVDHTEETYLTGEGEGHAFKAGFRDMSYHSFTASADADCL